MISRPARREITDAIYKADPCRSGDGPNRSPASISRTWSSATAVLWAIWCPWTGLRSPGRQLVTDREDQRPPPPRRRAVRAPDGRGHIGRDVEQVGVDVLAAELVTLLGRAPRFVEVDVPLRRAFADRRDTSRAAQVIFEVGPRGASRRAARRSCETACFSRGGRVGHGCAGSLVARETDVREDVGGGRGGAWKRPGCRRNGHGVSATMGALVRSGRSVVTIRSCGVYVCTGRPLIASHPALTVAAVGRVASASRNAECLRGAGQSDGPGTRRGKARPQR